jgi:hypothetical protein
VRVVQCGAYLCYPFPLGRLWVALAVVQLLLSLLIRHVLAEQGVAVQHLGVKLWDGKLTLRRLQLDPAILDRLDLPLSCAKGMHHGTHAASGTEGVSSARFASRVPSLSPFKR